ncbi:hypothetical protein TREMEDRAFT_74182 [Tremella mesenterica DSM 1558]|uniref:uncharacterized protein n=1 Tax=Tremella mesenterica (strain ATCC 24925 / CBS 8224 / DSM 1558 / NBRC 9311 / NRRL Y-6157 / RJB 2259-6 / UBC 559-6) TaxID=578456 RepID=UPI0003F49302|nr:uncharacterized protein TREMEDRAFT_74182 [Tremella mesenterica DSM 1558]EIW68840.1 hypothetical protein TREMEDRAFT_74182 [Tremella mesenterica DSM 1558]
MSQSSSNLVFSDLPLTHPALLEILETTSLRQTKANVKFLQRCTTVLRSDNTVRGGTSEVDAVLGILLRVVRRDKEGWAVSTWGKVWLGITIDLINASPSTLTDSAIRLLETIITVSPQWPSFERESVLPLMGKISVTLVGVLQQIGNDWSTLQDVPLPVRMTASDLLASLHLCGGKTQAAQAWAGEMKGALGGMNDSLSAIMRDAWETPTTLETSSLATLPVDPTERLPTALSILEGSTEIILALLRFVTVRPVPVPIGAIVEASLRCMNITYDTPMVSYISPHHHASILVILPRIWTVGSLLLGAMAMACGDHLLPHLSSILEHSVYLLESVPVSQIEVRVRLLRLHQLLLDVYPATIWPVEYTTRLTKFVLSCLSPILDKPSESSHGPKQDLISSGKRGKKRVRNDEDGLISGLEGRDGRGVSDEEMGVMLEVMNLLPSLLTAPLLPTALLTFSIRLLLSLSLLLPTLTKPSPQSIVSLQTATQGVLNHLALSTEGEGGTSRSWKTVLLSLLPISPATYLSSQSLASDSSLCFVLQSSQVSRGLGTMLHPVLPPLMRPGPPLSALHLFGKETEEEADVRKEVGFGAPLPSHVEDEMDEIVPRTEIVSRIDRVAGADERTEGDAGEATPAESVMVESEISSAVIEVVKHVSGSDILPEPDRVESTIKEIRKWG